ncbi:hypothetical protein AADW59_00755 [Candidatus Hodgkinia cicadicola]
MNKLELLPRSQTGSRACKLLRAAGFIPGIVRLGIEHTLAVSVCAKAIKRLPYKQCMRAVLNGEAMVIRLSRYQLDPVSYDIQHVEYELCKRVLAHTLARVLMFNLTNCAAVKLGAKIKTLKTRVNLIGEISLSPNYIKADVSEHTKGDDVLLTRLHYKCVQFATTEPHCVLATIR